MYNGNSFEVEVSFFIPSLSLHDLMPIMGGIDNIDNDKLEQSATLIWKGKCIQNDVARTSNDVKLTLLRERRAAEISLEELEEEDLGPLLQQENVEESNKSNFLYLYSLTADYVLDEAHTVSSTRWENLYFDGSTTRISNPPKDPEFNGIQDDNLKIILKEDAVFIIARTVEEGICAEEKPCASMCYFWNPQKEGDGGESGGFPGMLMEKLDYSNWNPQKDGKFGLVPSFPPTKETQALLDRGLVRDVLNFEGHYSDKLFINHFFNTKYRDYKNRRLLLLNLIYGVLILKRWGYSEQYIEKNVRGELGR